MPETDRVRTKRMKREAEFQRLGEASWAVSERHEAAWRAEPDQRQMALLSLKNAVAAYKTAISRTRAAVREEEAARKV